MVQELTAEDYYKEIEKDVPLIVDFWASWCGPCRMLAPAFEEVSKEYAGRLRFAKLSTEDYPEIATENNIVGIPCLIVFNEGKEVDRIIGNAPKELLKEKIDRILKKI